MEATQQPTSTPQPSVTAANAPPPTSPEPAAAAPERTAHELVAELFQRARQGDPAVREPLARLLDQRSILWENIGDIARSLEQRFVDQIAGKDLLVEGSIRRKLEKLKRDLAGDDSSPLEKLLCERVAVAWLATTYAEIAEVLGEATGTAAAKFRMQRAESANRRFAAAARALATVRRLGAGVKLQITHVTNQAASAVTGDSVAHRLREAFDSEAKLDRDLAGGMV